MSCDKLGSLYRLFINKWFVVGQKMPSIPCSASGGKFADTFSSWTSFMVLQKEKLSKLKKLFLFLCIAENDWSRSKSSFVGLLGRDGVGIFPIFQSFWNVYLQASYTAHVSVLASEKHVSTYVKIWHVTTYAFVVADWIEWFMTTSMGICTSTDISNTIATFFH